MPPGKSVFAQEFVQRKLIFSAKYIILFPPYAKTSRPLKRGPRGGKKAGQLPHRRVPPAEWRPLRAVIQQAKCPPERAPAAEWRPLRAAKKQAASPARPAR